MTDQQTEQLRTFLAEVKLPLLWRLSRVGTEERCDAALTVQIGLDTGNRGADLYHYEIGATQGRCKSTQDLDDFTLTEHGFSFVVPDDDGGLRQTFAEPQTLEEVQAWCAPWLILPDTVQSLLGFRKWILDSGRTGPEYWDFPL